MHCHCYEYDIAYLREITDQVKLVCVSEDPSSSYATLELSKTLDVEPCLGIHPWVIHGYSRDDLIKVLNTIVENNVRCIGEVGLDKRFRPHTYDHQLEMFRIILSYSREHDLVLNLHTAGAWRETFEELVKYDIDKAYFHWYTGPLELVDDIVGSGYFIGINPAWIIQEKHRKVVDKTPLEWLMTESDAPYQYRELQLNPLMVIDTVKYISSVKQVDMDQVVEKIWRNYLETFSSRQQPQ